MSPKLERSDVSIVPGPGEPAGPLAERDLVGPGTWLRAPEQDLDDSILLIPHNNVTTNGHSPDDCLPHEDEAVAAGQADGGAHRVVPAGHQAAV